MCLFIRAIKISIHFDLFILQRKSIFFSASKRRSRGKNFFISTLVLTLVKNKILTSCRIEKGFILTFQAFRQKFNPKYSLRRILDILRVHLCEAFLYF